MTVTDWFLHFGWTVRGDGCWEWNGRFEPVGGYGTVQSKGRNFVAHRVSYEHHKGPIPDGMIVMHSCDYRPCVNPAHLSVGTDADNVADMDAKGRRTILRGSANGMSALTETDVLRIRSLPQEYGSGVRLAREYGVHPTLISAVRLGKAWKHV